MMLLILSLYDDTLQFYVDTLLLYDDTLSLHDDTLLLYDDTLSLHDDTLLYMMVLCFYMMLLHKKKIGPLPTPPTCTA